MKSELLKIAREILSKHTAPFRESVVSNYIQSFCEKRKVSCFADEFGNLMVGSKKRGSNQKFAFVAHMDHPGFIIEKITGKGTATALFYGGWDPAEFKAAPIAVFCADGQVKARALTWEMATKERGRRAHITFKGNIAPGDIAMWDLDIFRKEGTMLYSRACDDLIGCALILTLIDLHSKSDSELPFLAVFTVAEEAGLHGAKYLCTRNVLSKGKIIPVSVECSRAFSAAPIGDGVVIRVGDSRTVFSPDITGFMVSIANEFKKKDKKFKFQRKLMDGGQCEGSVFSEFGYRTAGLSIPLGNYHNRNFEKGATESEYVSIDDLHSAVKLMNALVENSDKIPISFQEKPGYIREEGVLGQVFLIKKD